MPKINKITLGKISTRIKRNNRCRHMQLPPCECICECPCESTGELILNGGMEEFNVNIPSGWNTTTPTRVYRATDEGEVHSGNSAVGLRGNADLWQDVEIVGGCYYELSFFAHANNQNLALNAMVIFISSTNEQTPALYISIRERDLPTNNGDFGFYRGITTKAPQDAVKARIRFNETTNVNNSLTLDDVSFSVR